jgi:ssDNA-binding Zn-finger/Zn-ribbon topoisomerase 1
MMFMYYETDGDSGYYNIRLFTSRLDAEKYHKLKNNPYGNTIEIAVDEGLETPEKKPLIENLKCPECDSKMVSRKGQYGTFWGCSRYPNCRGTRDSQGRSKAERQADRNKEPSGEIEHSAVDRIAENDKFKFRKS